MSRQAQTICPCSDWSRYVVSSIHQPPLMLPQRHGFMVIVCTISLRFCQEPVPQGSGLQLCMAGRQTHWYVAIPEVLQYLHTNANKFILLFMWMVHSENYYPVFNYPSFSIGNLFSSQFCVQLIPARNCLVATHCRCNMFILAFPCLLLESPHVCGAYRHVWEMGVLIYSLFCGTVRCLQHTIV